jgi:hypothetical protein
MWPATGQSINKPTVQNVCLLTSAFPGLQARQVLGSQWSSILSMLSLHGVTGQTLNRG